MAKRRFGPSTLASTAMTKQRIPATMSSTRIGSIADQKGGGSGDRETRSLRPGWRGILYDRDAQNVSARSRARARNGSPGHPVRDQRRTPHYPGIQTGGAGGPQRKGITRHHGARSVGIPPPRGRRRHAEIHLTA